MLEYSKKGHRLLWSGRVRGPCQRLQYVGKVPFLLIENVFFKIDGGYKAYQWVCEKDFEAQFQWVIPIPSSGHHPGKGRYLQLLRQTVRPSSLRREPLTRSPSHLQFTAIPMWYEESHGPVEATDQRFELFISRMSSSYHPRKIKKMPSIIPSVARRSMLWSNV